MILQIEQSFLHQELNNHLHLQIKLFLIKNGEYDQIYDSHTSLFREFVVFRVNREIRLTTCKPDTYQILHPYNVSIEELTNCSSNNTNIYLSTIIAHENDLICGKEQQVFFSIQPKDSHTYITGKQSGLYYNYDGQDYPHYRKVEYLTIMLDPSVKAQAIVLKIAHVDKYFPLSSCSKFDGNKYLIDLSAIECADNGIHTILVSEVVRHKLLHKIEYFVDTTLTFRINTDYVFDKHLLDFCLVSNLQGKTSVLYEGMSQVGNERMEIEYLDGKIVYHRQI